MTADVTTLPRAALAHLDEALAGLNAPHAPGQRENHRAGLALAIEAASAAQAAATEVPARVLAWSILARAHAARAEDALHGAGQLSLSAQRAPTCAACDEGWRRVEAIARVAETSARDAERAVEAIRNLDAESAAARRAFRAARRGAAAALAARRIVELRNHAYTFHTDGGFSFGEGWYLAAAAVLAGVAIQIEPGPAERTAQAATFLGAAGLAHVVQAYRSRPRAMKQTTELVARAFRADPASAQARLRAAFLGDEPISSEVSGWIERKLAARPAPSAGKKVLVWIRDGVHHPGRNSTGAEVHELAACVSRAGLVPVLTGDALRDTTVPEDALDMILFWKDPLFRRADMRRAQLQFFEELRGRHGLVGQIGVTTAGMDGPALMGLPTLYLTAAPNARMGAWVGAVPGYVEVVREDGYLERITRTLSQWACR
ncbi:MAG TPA: hypothetical protein VMI54_10840 [Polyangiaceae bacterium]|nr:hypothetical protein [Polyangiaceae bacterium]